MIIFILHIKSEILTISNIGSRINFHDFIVALNNVNKETLQLKKMGVLEVFTKYVDKKYHMPLNWAQTDCKTTLSDIVNFMLNGYKKGGYYGIKFYFDRLYLNNNRPLVIIY